MFGNQDAGGTTQKYRTIKEAAGEYNVSDLCMVSGVSRSGYYAYLKRQEMDSDKPLKDLIQENTILIQRKWSY